MPDLIYEKLKSYAKKSPVRMHMPGHKGDVSLMPFADTDITEIDGFDNLHHPTGIIKDSMTRASGLWGSKKSFYLVNGSTCGILAGIRALTKEGDKVIVARNSHKSVYNAIELCSLNSIYVMPRKIPDWNVFGSVSPDDIEKLFNENKDVKLVVITSPTYEGVISDIEKIAEIAHKNGAKLLVDEAHGAHLGFGNYFHKSSITLGADVVVQSLHKTLACPTQTAILHIGDLTLEKAVSKQLAVFQTSSPSYLFMSAIDALVNRMDTDKNCFKNWTDALDGFYNKTKSLKNIEVLADNTDSDSVYCYDKSKIVIRCADNIALAQFLRDDFNVEFELVNNDFVLAMTGLGDNEETLDALFVALKKADISHKRANGSKRPFIYHSPEVYESSALASKRSSSPVSISDAVGKVCAEYVWEYPPGIPLIVPGEIVCADFCKNIADGLYNNLSSDNDMLPDYLAVYEKE